ncbi:toxin-antitoxin system YwqK family antitoxin [Chitinophaga flava]|uniref:Toxin-antitoxin system YwqK family antitoxin n=1 Tax=Chitinophaga flava TaxID=2259036 RepID=A0A365Y1K1_9BACT|nr:hypothetical protein [Chitinophaga flava]RBL91715.1 hypothetical protein DF182_03665 [Chitinophaga flava]
MKKILVPVIICISALLNQSQAQQVPDIKTNHITIRRNDTVYTFYTYNRSKKIVPKRDKYYYWYKTQQIIYTHGGYSGQVLDGDYTEFYPNKNLKAKGSFKKGLKTGIWHSWNPNGEFIQITTWKSGEKNGESFEYDSTGHLTSKSMYSNGQLHGPSTTYSSKGVEKTIIYKNGQLVPEKAPKDSSVKKIQ